MKIEFEHPGGKVLCDASAVYDLSLSIRKQGNVNCYYLDDPAFSYFESPEFSGNLSAGGSVNCEKISLYAHASGTHTECALHVCQAGFDMRHISLPPLMLCRLVSVEPAQHRQDRIINLESIAGLDNPRACQAIVFRTLPNGEDKKQRNYSGSNPPYFSAEVLTRLKSLGFSHLITDLPSIDRESDDGMLAAHKAWFITDNRPDIGKTVTELVYVPDAAADGIYALSMQFPSIETDAVPSRILLYPCV